MKKYVFLILLYTLIIFSCNNTTQPEDCLGVEGGNAILDECGVCNGNGAPENYDCNGNCTATIDCSGACGGDAMEDCAGDCNGDAVEDCAGDCGGSSGVVDVCGICGGSGSPCTVTGLSGIVMSDPAGDALDFSYDDSGLGNEPNSLWIESNGGNSWNVMFNSDNDIGGFQFKVDGAYLTNSNNAYGGEAAAANFDIIGAPEKNIILGFSFSGDTISPGADRILVTFDVII